MWTWPGSTKNNKRGPSDGRVGAQKKGRRWQKSTRRTSRIGDRNGELGGDRGARLRAEEQSQSPEVQTLGEKRERKNGKGAEREKELAIGMMKKAEEENYPGNTAMFNPGDQLQSQGEKRGIFRILRSVGIANSRREKKKKGGKGIL